MPRQAQDFSAEIKRKLIESDKTFEFFALSLTLMLSTPESERAFIAETCAQHSGQYFGLHFHGNQTLDKAMRHSFKQTLATTLTQDFNFEKAAQFVFHYLSTPEVMRQSIQTLKMGKSPKEIISNIATFRFVYFHEAVKNHVNSFDKASSERINKLIDFTEFDKAIIQAFYQKQSLAINSIGFSFIFAALTLVIIGAYITNNLRLEMMYDEHPRVTPASFTLFVLGEITILWLLRQVGGKFVSPMQNNLHANLSKAFTHALINAIHTTFVRIDQKPQANEQPETQESMSYHFSLFNLPSLSDSKPTQTTTEAMPTLSRTTPKIKTRSAAPKLQAQPRKNDVAGDVVNCVRHNGIQYYRITSFTHKPTQDFIGLDKSKVAPILSRDQMKKIKAIIKNPSLVGKKAESGIVNITREKQISKNRQSNWGLFKIKDKTMDSRVITEKKTSAETLNGKKITLHTASIVTKHTSRKNH